jgi:thiamine-phosphate pyrophosphorylase
LQRTSLIKTVNRIIDANINRAKEGLRVCEEIVRFILESRDLTSRLKKIRHKIDALFKVLPSHIILLKERHSLTDVGRDIYIKELQRKNYQDIFFANIQRVKESVRVLEEFSKLINIKVAVELKKIRYAIYEIEKKVAEKLSSLHYCR